ncbi:LamG domain-containing protein [Paenibacillus thiaminolyticus]|nr:LamG domain-containing protein [Paenibacillus thiaminolyticus]
MKPNEQGTASETVAKTQDAVNVVGYADRFSVQPGQALNFMIDTASSSYTASVVRICGGMPDPDHSPYLPTEPVPADCAGEYPGRRQTAAIGSYAELPLPEEWMQAGEFSLQMWVYPTLPQYEKAQTIWSAKSADGSTGAYVTLDKDGHVTFSLIGGCGHSVAVRSEAQLHGHEWHFVAVQYSVSREAAMLFVSQRVGWRPDDGTQVTTEAAKLDYSQTVISSVLLAADSDAAAPGGVSRHYNGKIGNPRLFQHYFTEAQLYDLARGTQTEPDGARLIADYDFSVGISTTRLSDRSAGGHHGILRQGGTRAVTSHNWTGSRQTTGSRRSNTQPFIFMTTTSRMPAGKPTLRGGSRRICEAASMR